MAIDITGLDDERGGEHVKKQRRKRQREKSGNGLDIGSGLNPDGTPVASTSKAVYVPPAELVERYKRGNPVTSTSVSRCYTTFSSVVF